MFVCLVSNSSRMFPSLWGPFQMYLLHLVSSLPSRYTAFVFSRKVKILLYFSLSQYYYHYSVSSFSHQRLSMVSQWNLSESKYQVFSILLNILADLNTLVWMVSTHPLIYKSSSPRTNPLETVPSAPITIGITVTFMFHRFL